MHKLRRNPFTFIGVEWDLGSGTRFGPSRACPHLERRGLNLKHFVSCQDGLPFSGIQNLRRVVSDSLHVDNQRTIVIGGGRESIVGHLEGLLDYCSADDKLGILNYHPRTHSNSHESREPTFKQIRDMCLNKRVAFNYTSVGLQSFKCASSIYDHADMYAITEFAFDELDVSVSHIKKVVERCDYVYLSICLDVFSGSIAPGVSSPQPFGLFPHHVLPYFDFIADSGKLLGADILEYNPSNDDTNEITGRLLADIALRLVKSTQDSSQNSQV